MLQLKSGAAEITPTHVEGQVTFTRRQLAVRYAGGYRSTTSARTAGVHAGSEKALASLVRSTADLEPWLPDHFQRLRVLAVRHTTPEGRGTPMAAAVQQPTAQIIAANPTARD